MISLILVVGMSRLARLWQPCKFSFSFQVATDKLLWKCARGQTVPGGEPLSLNNKRLLLESKLDDLPGVQFVFSTISGHTSKAGSPTFWVGCFVAYAESESTVGRFLENFMYDVGLSVMAPMKNRKSVAEQLAFIVKDHKNQCIKVSSSSVFAYTRILCLTWSTLHYWTCLGSHSPQQWVHHGSGNSSPLRQQFTSHYPFHSRPRRRASWSDS